MQYTYLAWFWFPNTFACTFVFLSTGDWWSVITPSAHVCVSFIHYQHSPTISVFAEPVSQLRIYRIGNVLSYNTSRLNQRHSDGKRWNSDDDTNILLVTDVQTSKKKNSLISCVTRYFWISFVVIVSAKHIDWYIWSSAANSQLLVE